MKILTAAQQRLNETFWRSPELQYLYSASEFCRARALEAVSTPYSSLVRHCNAARRIRDPHLKVHRLAGFADFVRRHSRATQSGDLSDNPFVKSFLKSEDAESGRKFWRKFPFLDRLNLRGNLILLKAPAKNERGVLLLTYTGAFQFFLETFDIAEISKQYTIVLEPSWATFPEPYMGFFGWSDPPAICEMISQEAADLVTNAGIPLSTIAIGAQDWVDTDVFKPIPGVDKEFDVVMVAAFAPWKRHAILFQAIRKLRPLRLRVALIGNQWGWTRAEFEEHIHKNGVEDNCTVFQGISPFQVNEVLNRSKVNVLLTRIEGGNRALSEALSANVPSIVYRHIMGPRRTDINRMTGVFSEDAELSDVLLQMLKDYKTFEPREWYLKNSGYRNSTRKLNQALRALASERGEKWTRDIAEKVNRPDAVYANETEAALLQGTWKEFEKFVRQLAE